MLVLKKKQFGSLDEVQAEKLMKLDPNLNKQDAIRLVRQQNQSMGSVGNIHDRINLKSNYYQSGNSSVPDSNFMRGVQDKRAQKKGYQSGEVRSGSRELGESFKEASGTAKHRYNEVSRNAERLMDQVESNQMNNIKGQQERRVAQNKNHVQNQKPATPQPSVPKSAPVTTPTPTTTTPSVPTKPKPTPTPTPTPTKPTTNNSIMSKAGGWMKNNPWKTAAIGTTAVIGTGMAIKSLMDKKKKEEK